MKKKKTFNQRKFLNELKLKRCPISENFEISSSFNRFKLDDDNKACLKRKRLDYSAMFCKDSLKHDNLFNNIKIKKIFQDKHNDFEIIENEISEENKKMNEFVF